MEKEIIKKVERSIDEERITNLVRDLTVIPSVSKEESEIASFLADYLKKMGIEVELQENVGGEKGSMQVVGKLKGTGEGPTLMLNGHIDHLLPPEAMKDPYSGEIKDDYLYGIGTTNMTGGLAANVCAVESIIKAGLDLKGDIILACPAQECIGGHGTKHLLEKGIRADYAVVPEATDLKFVTRHIGVTWQRINIVGETSHYCSRSTAGRPLGIDALRKALKVVEALGPSMGGESMEPIKPGGWLTFSPQKDWGPMLNVGNICCGRRQTEGHPNHNFPNMVPDFCTMLVDFRLIPGQTNETVRRDLENLFEKLKTEDPELHVEVEEIPNYMPPFEVDTNSPIVQSVGKWHEYVTNQKPEFNPPRGSFPWGFTDASTLKAAGIQPLIYGPGGHFLKLADEKIELKQVVTATKVLALTAADICSRQKE